MSESWLEQLENDEQLKPFLDSQLDVNAHTSTLLTACHRADDPLPLLADQLSKLARGVALIDDELHKQVASNHESLLQQVSHIKELEKTLSVVTVGVEALQKSIDRCVLFEQR